MGCDCESECCPRPKNNISNCNCDCKCTPNLRKCSLRRCRDFFINNFLPIGLAFVIILGVVWPTPGKFLDHEITDYVAIIGIFLISGLFLKTDEMKKALTSYVAVIWGFASVMFITSAIGVTLVGELPYDKVIFKVINGTREKMIEKGVFGPPEIEIGMQVFLSTPTTVSSAVIMVSTLGGNYALALLLTVACNILGTFTIPLLIKWLIKLEGSVTIEIAPLLLRLFLTVFIPTVAGKAISYVKPIHRFCMKFKTPLKMLSIVCLLLFPWTKISSAKASGSLGKLSLVALVLVVCTASLVHVIFLIINVIASYVLRFNTSQRKCIVILASQKTVAVALSIVTFLPPAAGAQGLLVIPMLVSHFTIIMIDALIIAVWLRFSPVYEELENEEPENEEQKQQALKDAKEKEEEKQPLISETRVA